MMQRVKSFSTLWTSFAGMMDYYEYQEKIEASRSGGEIVDASWKDKIKVYGCLLQLSSDAKSSDQLIKNSEATHSFITKETLSKCGKIIDKAGRAFQIVEKKLVADIIGFNKYLLKETEYAE